MDPTNTSAQGHALNILSRVESLESQHSTSRVSHSITSHLDKHLIISTHHVDKGATTHFLSSTPRMYPVPINLPEAEAREQIEVQIRAVERTTPEPSTQEMKGKGADEVVEPFTPGTRERVAGTFQQIAGHVLRKSDMVERGKQRRHSTTRPTGGESHHEDKGEGLAGDRPGMRDMNSKGPLYQSAGYVARF